MGVARRECMNREYERLLFHERKVKELHVDTGGAGKVFWGVV